MAKGNLNEEMVECHHTNGTITMVPAHVFAKIVMEMENMPPGKYVTYKEGAKMYRMSEKFFCEWVNSIGAAKHITDNKVIVSIEKIDRFLEYL